MLENPTINDNPAQQQQRHRRRTINQPETSNTARASIKTLNASCAGSIAW